jgi:hypothetical protein
MFMFTNVCQNVYREKFFVSVLNHFQEFSIVLSMTSQPAYFSFGYHTSELA